MGIGSKEWEEEAKGGCAFLGCPRAGPTAALEELPVLADVVLSLHLFSPPWQGWGQLARGTGHSPSQPCPLSKVMLAWAS